MKKQIGIVIFYAAAVFLTGCIQPSLNPLFTDKEIFIDPNLLGTWELVDNAGSTLVHLDDRWEFKKVQAGFYELNVKNDEKKGTFVAALGQIDNNRFLDIFPINKNRNDSDFYKQHIIGMHSFAWVKQTEPTIKIALIDSEKVDKLIEVDPNVIKHERMDDRIILTADTNELQKFIINYGINANEENSIFEDAAELVRIEDECSNITTVPLT